MTACNVVGVFRAKTADKIITHGVAAPPGGNTKNVLCQISMYILSYVLGNKIFNVSGALIKQIIFRLVQINLSCMNIWFAHQIYRGHIKKI